VLDLKTALIPKGGGVPAKSLIRGEGGKRGDSPPALRPTSLEKKGAFLVRLTCGKGGGARRPGLNPRSLEKSPPISTARGTKRMIRPSERPA